jgi:hypothetical protein
MSEIYQLRLADNQMYPYKLVKSHKAKYIRIKVSSMGELSVVLPRGISEKHAHSFLQTKSQWVLKTIANTVIAKNNVFPESLDLKLLGEYWSLNYIKSNENTCIQLKETSENSLEITGNIEDWDNVKKIINRWCKLKAKQIFITMLEALAEEHGFHFNRLSIRSQKTRWGSCSTAKNINLNSKLLFMPIDVAKYVMIHELCHTIEMNHSSRFWQLVEDCDANYKKNRKQLKTLGKAIVI